MSNRNASFLLQYENAYVAFFKFLGGMLQGEAE